MKRIAYEEMKRQFARVLESRGFSAEDARSAGEIFAQNSLTGVYSHGLNRFPRVVEYLDKGEIDPNARAECVMRMGAIERWDGHRGFGPLNAWRAKDSGSSIVLDLIATVLTNGNSVAKIGSFGDEIGLSQVMIAIDPGKFDASGETDEIVNAILADVKASVPAQECGEVFYPGEMELARIRENWEQGIPVIEEVWQRVLAM